MSPSSEACAALRRFEQQLRKIRGHRDRVRLVRALARHELEHSVRTEEQAA